MYQRLSRINRRGLFLETDPVALKRTAMALSQYLTNELPGDGELNVAAHGITRDALLDTLLPVCEQAISGQMVAALDDQASAGLFFRYPVSEGLFPKKLARLIRKFQLEAQGYGTELAEPVEINGERFCLREFEEPGDWPEKIRAAEEQRRRKDMGERYVPVDPAYYGD